MKNVTISMDDKLLEQVRIRAAKEGKNVSKFLAEAAVQRVAQPNMQAEAVHKFLSGPLWDISGPDGRLPTRDEIYER
jgi:hypothetical protein